MKLDNIIIKITKSNCYLEDYEVLVAGPDHVGVHGALLGVARHPGVGALVDIIDIDIDLFIDIIDIGIGIMPCRCT